LLVAQGDREAFVSACVERESIVRGGTRRLRASVGVGESDGDTAAGERVSAHRWITAREPAAPRGARDPGRGERSEERIPRTVAARNKAAKLGTARKPLRG